MINLQFLNDKIFSLLCMFIGSVHSLNTKFCVKVDHRHSVVFPGLDHPVHQLPLSGKGVKLQDVIIVGGTVITA